MYAKYIKRPLDLMLSLAALVILSPVLLVLTVTGVLFMKGNPFFTQLRPGKNEKIFRLVKFRTMSLEKDSQGNLLPDERRLNRYGRFLRSTSLDELPELWNIFCGDMSLIGPRPLLVSYLPYYTDREKLRHTVRPGLTGLAQVSGRNFLEWDKRLEKDVEYVENLSFGLDIKIFFTTVKKVFVREDVAVDTNKLEGNLAEIRKAERESN